MNEILDRLKSLESEDARYTYADSITNAFLTAQIKALREQNDLTQGELAELVGTKQSGISRWQHSGYSSCKVETLRKFARAFKVRLRITFEEFGSLPDDLGGFTKERLAPKTFDDDPAFRDVLPQDDPIASVDFNRSLSPHRFGSLQALAGIHPSIVGQVPSPRPTEMEKRLNPEDASALRNLLRRWLDTADLSEVIELRRSQLKSGDDTKLQAIRPSEDLSRQTEKTFGAA